MNDEKVVSILEISYQLANHLKNNGGWGEGALINSYGCNLRKGCHGYRSIPEAYRLARALANKTSYKGSGPSTEEVIGCFAVYLLDVYKRDWRIKCDLSEEMFKSTKINNVTYIKNGIIEH